MKHGLVVEGINKEDTPPQLEFKSASPQIAEVRTTIDWTLKMIAMSKGINPNTFVAEVNSASGVSKLMDSLEQFEIRQDDLEPCRVYEDDRYDKTKKIIEFHKSEIEGYKKLDGFFVCDFAEIKQNKTLQDSIKEDEYKYKYNLQTPLDVLRRQNPDLNNEELRKKYDENKMLNAELGIKEIMNPQKVNGESTDGNFFKQDDLHSCGECVVNSIMSMYGKVLKEEMNTDSGTSPETIMSILNKNGIKTTAKDLNIEELKPKSIIWYKDSDHYVTVETVNGDELLINDSLKDGAETLTKEEVEKLWDNWVIETNL
jgi:predicted double-glycine peptidase